MFEGLLGGHPVAISLAASLFKSTNIDEVYNVLVKTTLLNTLTQGTAGKSSVTENLYSSLDLTLKLFNDHKIYEFFHMMGYFPGGAREEDIDIVWKEVNKGKRIEWIGYCRYLENASIVIRKKVKLNNNSVEVFQLVPMLKNIAEEGQEINERKNMHKIVTLYYIKILNEILKENSVSQVSTENEVLMNNLWFFEMNIWDCIYRALEIKKISQFNKVDTFGSDDNPDKDRSVSPPKKRANQLKDDDDAYFRDHSDTIFKSGISNDFLNHLASLDGENELFSIMQKNRKAEETEQNHQTILGELVDKVKAQIMPNSGSSDEIEDKNVLSFIKKSALPGQSNADKPGLLIKPKPKIKKKKIEAEEGSHASFLIREMDKRLKKTVNEKVANIIKNHKKLVEMSIPKEQIYEQLAHKLFETQEKHKLYKGLATHEVYRKGKTLKEINDDSKILILYLTNLILFSKKSDAVKSIDEYGSYFYDRSLCEANIRKLKGIALIRNKKEHNFELATDALKEFLHAKVIFQRHNCIHGVALC